MHKEEKKLTIEDYKTISVEDYNKILPMVLCPHCGKILDTGSVWNNFYNKEKKDSLLYSHMQFFYNLLDYEDKDILALYQETFKCYRYCCKMTILETYLNIKRMLMDKLLKDKN